MSRLVDAFGFFLPSPKVFEANEHPMLRMLLDIAETCSLTLDGAHRLFGYDLRRILDYDLRLNGGRTHIECPHERLRAGEVHRSLGVSETRKGECENRWPNTRAPRWGLGL